MLCRTMYFTCIHVEVITVFQPSACDACFAHLCMVSASQFVHCWRSARSHAQQMLTLTRTGCSAMSLLLHSGDLRICVALLTQAE